MGKLSEETPRTEKDEEEISPAGAGAIIPKAPSDTVGTGSYIAVSCSVMALLATVLLIAGLLIARWLS